jgi:hypothetical protein
MDSDEQQLGTWQSPDAGTYAVVAHQLVLLAEQAETPELRLQYGQLAALYEQLAMYAVKMARREVRTAARQSKSATIH